MSKVSDAKKIGRPPTGVGTPVTVRLQPDMLDALDAWITDQPEPRPSRPEAIRRLIDVATTGKRAGPYNTARR